MLIDCNLSKVDNTTVLMRWEANEYDASDIEACIVAKRNTITTTEEIYRNCTNASSGFFYRTVPQTYTDYAIY